MSDQQPESLASLEEQITKALEEGQVREEKRIRGDSLKKQGKVRRYFIQVFLHSGRSTEVLKVGSLGEAEVIVLRLRDSNKPGIWADLKDFNEDKQPWIVRGDQIEEIRVHSILVEA